jgi:hypothetical protein
MIQPLRNHHPLHPLQNNRQIAGSETNLNENICEGGFITAGTRTANNIEQNLS